MAGVSDRRLFCNNDRAISVLEWMLPKSPDFPEPEVNGERAITESQVIPTQRALDLRGPRAPSSNESDRPQQDSLRLGRRAPPEAAMTPPPKRRWWPTTRPMRPVRTEAEAKVRFEEFYQRYKDPSVRFLGRACAKYEGRIRACLCPEDIAAAVFTRFYAQQSLRYYEPRADSAFHSWLATCLHNELLDVVRKIRREPMQQRAPIDQIGVIGKVVADPDAVSEFNASCLLKACAHAARRRYLETKSRDEDYEFKEALSMDWISRLFVEPSGSDASLCELGQCSVGSLATRRSRLKSSLDDLLIKEIRMTFTGVDIQGIREALKLRKSKAGDTSQPHQPRTDTDDHHTDQNDEGDETTGPRNE